MNNRMSIRNNSSIITIILLVCLIYSVSAEGAREAESFPIKPVELVVPFAPGGNSDLVARALDTVVGKYFPQPLVIVNKPGAGGAVGVGYALGKTPDGYTLLISSWGAFVTQPHLNKLQYDENDYIPVMQVGFTTRVIMAHPDTPYNSLDEMIEYAKANPQKIKVGITSVGATDHLAMAQLELENNIQFTYIPQDGSGGAKVSILGHHTDVCALDVIVGGELVLAGQVKAFGVTAETRYRKLPDVPTCTEIGYPVISGVATHLYLPTGTPEDRFKIIHDAFKKTIDDPEFINMAERLQFDIVYKNSVEARQQLSSISSSYKKIINALGMGVSN